MRFAIVGAGFSGAVVARELADAGHSIEVFDARDHVAGNCHTARHETGVMVHTYGPHIFHTQHEHVWQYINRFGEMMPYRHKVKAISQGTMYSLPVNLRTINQFFGRNFDAKQAEEFIQSKADVTITNPVSFEDQGLRFVGRELYEAFFAGYTAKQWGVEPKELPASILARLPVRFNEDDSYFNHPYQAIPKDGYTPIVEAILNHASIKVRLGTRFDPGSHAAFGEFDHVVWTGPIDAYFNFEFGRLGYRTLDFVPEVAEGDYQGHPVVNYCDVDVPYTRITEHKHFAPWESHERTVVYREFSRLCGETDTPYYPIRLVKEKQQLLNYVQKARGAKGVTFIGRLGTYRYLDMDVTIHEALLASKSMLECIVSKKQLPCFSVDPMV
ncbi:MAG: UDP-galactopyranose mutase [Actinobacteria bacterium]|nr:UDP-galactopyranose mutase [Actinomycetota bacterium]NBP41622.1 UDP-galactopyranose mutase [Actinomycetota bacterium]NDA37773.1 UDP-galactopyranose mutase [Acidimicrobiia bacterium]NDB41944.1 UDP-galactopyranose mutase [Actinomycetota bacterium]NDF83921.1 UDP-galactopyranose mutase [Actinomycetota bacterium]